MTAAAATTGPATLKLAEGPAPERVCGSCTACCVVLPIQELRKPARWSCDHLSCRGCQIYPARPESCRAFHCLWLRGGLPLDLDWRPDRLGVMWDCFHGLQSGREYWLACELWAGALESPVVRELIERIARDRELEINYRDGRRRTLTPSVTADHSPPDAEDDIS